ncbi:MAG: NosD domain-containing protein, partial [Candidatus Kariarchaeaceae archaeon]
MLAKIKETKKDIRLIALIFIFLFSFLSFPSIFNELNANEENKNKLSIDSVLIEPRVSAQYNESLIHIDGNDPNNWTYTVGNNTWCYGSGTIEDPYIIENVTVDSSNTRTGILIENTDKYFIIRNCDVKNSELSANEGGIKFNNVDNGNITYSYIFDNQYGIILTNGCTNNNIYSNNISSNADSGVYLVTNANFNNISSNIITENNNYGVEIVTNSKNNTIFNNTVEKNDESNIYIAFSSDGNILEQNSIKTTNNSPNRHGITLNSCSYTRILNNTISFNKGHGISLTGDSNYIAQNIIFQNIGSGVVLNSGLSNTIISNNITDNGNRGVWISTSDYNTIINNTIADNDWDAINLVNGARWNNIVGNTIDNNVREIRVETNSHNNSIIENILNNSFTHNIGVINSHSINISDNLIQNAWSGYDGIYLDNSDFTRIIGNTIDNNDDDGISLQNCQNVQITENIIKNHQDSGDNGIYIYSASGNSGNKIFKNALFNNDRHAYDGGSNNQWNNSYIGNYWEGAGIGGDANRDGIGDGDYDVEPAGGSYDYLPIFGDPTSDGSPIHIDDSNSSGDGTWAWASTRLWCSGSGTWVDPYVIEGLEIDAGSSGSGLIIGNSSVYARIENSTFTNAGSAGDDAGIYLYSVNHTIIENNNCSSNQEHGILIQSSFNITVRNNILQGNLGHALELDLCLNSTVEDNYVSYNGGTADGIRVYRSSNNTVKSNLLLNNYSSTGIRVYITSYNNTFIENTIKNYLTGIIISQTCNGNKFIKNNISNSPASGISITTACEYNQFYQNRIYNSSLTGVSLSSNCPNNLFYNNSFILNNVHANDANSNNVWNTTIGNYWDDYSGVDKNNDYIGDSPYSFSGGIDYLPIWWDGYDLNSIYIDDSGFSGNGTWLWAVTQGWCSGDGSWQNPYIIEDVYIDANNQGSGLMIGNSTV